MSHPPNPAAGSTTVRSNLPPALWRRLLAEFVGTALLLTAVVGSGIMAQRLSPDDVGLQLLETALRPPPRWSRSSSPSARSPERTSIPSSPWPTGSSGR